MAFFGIRRMREWKFPSQEAEKSLVLPGLRAFSAVSQANYRRRERRETLPLNQG